MKIYFKLSFKKDVFVSLPIPTRWESFRFLLQFRIMHLYWLIFPTKFREKIYVYKNICLFRLYKFKPIEIGYFLEWIYVFETEQEAIRAHQFFEVKHNYLCGYWYGKNDQSYKQREYKQHWSKK